ncbi:MAG: hypothetical protein PUA82_04220 [Eubacteriales bacterium]|nr:hypothetical protein [Eubacteriales bacterium]
MLRMNGIKLKPGEPVSQIAEKAAVRLRVKKTAVKNLKIVKESIDARGRGGVRFVYTVDFETDDEERLLKRADDHKISLKKAPDTSYCRVISGYEDTSGYNGERPVIIGFGPCGMFAALILAEAGLRPIVLEQGRQVEQRSRDVEHFWETGELDEMSNVQFGEGGAGTFSDGKLTTGIKDPRIGKVNEEFIEAGASETIAYKHMPHIGTDVLKTVVKNIRRKITGLGGEIMFESEVVSLECADGTAKAVKLADGSMIESSHIVLAIGNSSRRTFETLYRSGIAMEAKPFSVGVRIEHPQSLINYAQYGEVNDSEGRLSAAVYKLSYHCRESGRGVYTFCMCPGGTVVGAASERECEVTNGMSVFARDGENANSALLVSVSPEDCMRETGDTTPLAGVKFQRALERSAYELGGGGYTAPAETVGEFLCRGTAEPAVKATYRPGVRHADLTHCLPAFVTDAMKEALPEMSRRLHGFDLDGALLTAVETRSSSPVRILRDGKFQSISAAGLFPGGEGAGYAGGIMSSAVDGVKIAEQIIKELCMK